jgi:hypothetical protein
MRRRAKIENMWIRNLAEKLQRIPARNKPPGFEDHYFLTDFDRLSGVEQWVVGQFGLVTV